MSRLTRRNALTAVAALPALAVPTAITAMAGPDAEVFAAGRAVEAAWQGLGKACDVLGVADKAMSEWHRHNPKPVMRKYQKASEIERDNWKRLVAEADDPIKVVAAIL